MDLKILLKHTSRSLYLSVQMLPASIRPAFGLAYLLCRYADTIADTSLLDISKRLYWVEQFPHLVRLQDTTRQAELTADLTGKSSNPYEAILITHLEDCLGALRALSQAHQPFVQQVVQDVCEGMKKDLITFASATPAAPAAFATEQDLTAYCRLMGGKPGLFWSRLITSIVPVKMHRQTFFEKGQQIGDALQIVNILRDLPHDLQNGRCYFPKEELTQAHLVPADLLQPENAPRFAPIKNKWIAWGKHNLQQAPAYYRAIPKTALRVRASVAWPILWTADTFAKLAQTADLLNPQKRVKIPRSRIYATMLVTPLLLLSNTCFEKWLSHKLKALP